MRYYELAAGFGADEAAMLACGKKAKELIRVAPGGIWRGGKSKATKFREKCELFYPKLKQGFTWLDTPTTASGLTIPLEWKERALYQLMAISKHQIQTFQNTKDRNGNVYQPGTSTDPDRELQEGQDEDDDEGEGEEEPRAMGGSRPSVENRLRTGGRGYLSVNHPDHLLNKRGREEDDEGEEAHISKHQRR